MIWPPPPPPLKLWPYSGIKMCVLMDNDMEMTTWTWSTAYSTFTQISQSIRLGHYLLQTFLKGDFSIWLQALDFSFKLSEHCTKLRFLHKHNGHSSRISPQIRCRYVRYALGKTTVYMHRSQGHEKNFYANTVLSQLGLASISFWSWSDRWLYSAITFDQKQDWSQSWT